MTEPDTDDLPAELKRRLVEGSLRLAMLMWGMLAGFGVGGLIMLRLAWLPQSMLYTVLGWLFAGGGVAGLAITARARRTLDEAGLARRQPLDPPADLSDASDKRKEG